MVLPNFGVRERRPLPRTLSAYPDHELRSWSVPTIMPQATNYLVTVTLSLGCLAIKVSWNI